MKNFKMGAIFHAVMMLFLVVSLVSVYTPSLFAAQPVPRYGGTLRVTDMVDGVSIGFPPKLLRVYGNRQVAPAIETLFRTDSTGNPVPFLAEGSKWDAKNKTITLFLRKGVKFHDGTDFNAEAAKWNLDQFMAAKTAGTEKFKSVDIVDNYTVRINLTEWDSTISSSFAQTLGMVISPAAYRKNGEKWCAGHPVGTGPFEFVSWDKDIRTVYKKFPGYWQKGKPYVDCIEWVPIADSQTRLLSFQKGEGDLMLTVAAKDVKELEKQGMSINRQGPPAGTYALVPSSANPSSPWSDVRVRRAAQHAIDSKSLLDSVCDGEGEVTNQFIFKKHWGYNSSIVGYPYNPAKAKQLLTEAGYPNGFKTILHYRTSPSDDIAFTAVQGFLKGVGIDAEMDPVQQAKFNQLAWDGGPWEGLLMSRQGANPDLTGHLAQSFAGGGKFYAQMLVPDDYLKAIQNSVTAADFETKQRWIREAMKLMIDKYALQIILVARSDAVVSKPYLHNHGFFVVPNTAFWTPEEAWLEK